MATTKKTGTQKYTVSFKLDNVVVGVDVSAVSLEEALQYARTLKTLDIIDSNNNDIEDYNNPIVTGVYQN